MYGKTGSYVESYASEYDYIKFISNGNFVKPSSDKPKKPDFTNNGDFDLADVIYAKKAFLKFDGYSIPTFKWTPLGGKEFDLQDVIWLKKAFLQFDGFDFSD